MRNETITIYEKEVRTTIITGEDLNLGDLERTCSFENAMDDDDDAFEEFMDWSNDDSYICDAISEIADGRVDIYNSDLWKNAANVQDYYEYYTAALYDNLDSLCTNYILRNMKDISIAFAFLKETTTTTEDIMEDLHERLDDNIDGIDSDHNNRFYDLIGDRDSILEDIFSDMMIDYEDDGLVIGLEDDIEDDIAEWLDENEEEEEEDDE